MIGSHADVDAAIEGVIAEATHNLWEAIAEWDFLLEQKSLFRRVQEQKKLREGKDVQYHSETRHKPVPETGFPENNGAPWVWVKM